MVLGPSKGSGEARAPQWRKSNTIAYPKTRFVVCICKLLFLFVAVSGFFVFAYCLLIVCLFIAFLLLFIRFWVLYVRLYFFYVCLNSCSYVFIWKCVKLFDICAKKRPLGYHFLYHLGAWRPGQMVSRAIKQGRAKKELGGEFHAELPGPTAPYKALIGLNSFYIELYWIYCVSLVLFIAFYLFLTDV